MDRYVTGAVIRRLREKKDGGKHAAEEGLRRKGRQCAVFALPSPHRLKHLGKTRHKIVGQRRRRRHQPQQDHRQKVSLCRRQSYEERILRRTVFVLLTQNGAIIS